VSGKSIEGTDVLSVRRAFFETMQQARVDMEDCSGESAKVDVDGVGLGV
jgi:hypothetical protein